MNKISNKRDSGLGELRRMFGMMNANNSRTLQESSKVQAAQAAQIGKLSSAIQELAEKNWNIQTNVKTNANRNMMQAIKSTF